MEFLEAEVLNIFISYSKGNTGLPEQMAAAGRSGGQDEFLTFRNHKSNRSFYEQEQQDAEEHHEFSQLADTMVGPGTFGPDQIPDSGK